MPVTLFGSGYVGLVTGASRADAGNHVICVDIDAGKIEPLAVHVQSLPNLSDLIAGKRRSASRATSM